MTTTTVSTTTTPTSAGSEFSEDIGVFHDVAKAGFDAAATIASTGKQQDETQEAADVRRSKAKSQMTAALDQMAHAQTMYSDQRGRVGYDAVVTVMEQSRDAISAVCTQIIQLANANVVSSDTTQLDRERQLAVYAEVLAKLAQVSPISVWQNYPPSNPQA